MQDVQKIAVMFFRTRHDEVWNCGLILQTNRCHIAGMEFVCPRMCGLCATPAAWSWSIANVDGLHPVCMSSFAKCDQGTSCGLHIASTSECQNAALKLGILSQPGAVVQLSSPTAPQGCFVVRPDDIAGKGSVIGGQVYFNLIGDPSGKFTFAKSLCQWQNVSAGILPADLVNASREEIIGPCGSNLGKMTVFEVEAQHATAAMR